MSILPELVQGNHKDQIISFLGNGENVNQKDAEGRTGLYCACEKNYAEIATLLLQQPNVNLYLQQKDGWTALHAACYHGFYPSVQILLQDPRTDLNVLDNVGWTPIMYACLNGKVTSDEIR